MIKYKLLIEYDGTNYCGFQIQPNVITIQGTIEKCLKNMTGLKIETFGASRTDKGVHAKGQVLHLFCNLRIKNNKFKEALNKRLPNDIRILKVNKAADEFHSRHSSKSKTYHYVFSKKKLTAFDYKNKIYIPYLDYKLMARVCVDLVGEHDFMRFSGFQEGRTTVKKIYECYIKETKSSFVFVIRGNNFLKYMVRSIVGTLIKIGEHKEPLDIFRRVFDDKIAYTRTTAPAQGLTLVKINY